MSIRQLTLSQFFVLLGRIAVLRTQMRPILTDRVAWSVRLSVCLSVCLSVTLVSPAKTATPIEMSFRLRTPVGPANHVLDGVYIPTCEGAILTGGRGVPL